MQQILRDTAGLGTLFWLIGYLAGIVLFFTALKTSMGWIMIVTFTPITIGITWWWFRSREHLSLVYYTCVGVSWMLVAVILDYLFIVTLFQSAAYYAPHIFLYYIMMVLIPVGIGLYLNRVGAEP